MSLETSSQLRLGIDERVDTEAVKHLRSKAESLRSRVSNGSYGTEELKQFFKLVRQAGIILKASNYELSEHAGLGRDYFTSVVRDQRYPKLANFLRALSAIIDVANERLNHGKASGYLLLEESATQRSKEILGQEDDLLTLLLLVTSLRQMARTELDKLDEARPNDPSTIEARKKERELLVLFLNGFAKIERVLSAYLADRDQPLFLGNTRKAVSNLGEQVNNWWKKHGADAIDWSIRLPFMTAGVAGLGWAGADMTVATSAIAAIVGGPKIIGALRGK